MRRRKLRSTGRAGTGPAPRAAKAGAEIQSIFSHGRARHLDKRLNTILNRHVRSCFRIRCLSPECLIVIDTIFDYAGEDEVAGALKNLALEPATIHDSM